MSKIREINPEIKSWIDKIQNAIGMEWRDSWVWKFNLTDINNLEKLYKHWDHNANLKDENTKKCLYINAVMIYVKLLPAKKAIWTQKTKDNQRHYGNCLYSLVRSSITPQKSRNNAASWAKGIEAGIKQSKSKKTGKLYNNCIKKNFSKNLNTLSITNGIIRHFILSNNNLLNNIEQKGISFKNVDNREISISKLIELLDNFSFGKQKQLHPGNNLKDLPDHYEFFTTMSKNYLTSEETKLASKLMSYIYPEDINYLTPEEKKNREFLDSLTKLERDLYNNENVVIRAVKSFGFDFSKIFKEFSNSDWKMQENKVINPDNNQPSEYLTDLKNKIKTIRKDFLNLPEFNS